MVVRDWADLLRVLVLGLGSFNIGMMLAIHHRTGAILPKALRLMGVSYALWTATGFAEIYLRFGEPVAARTVLELGATVTGTVALVLLDRYYEHVRVSDRSELVGADRMADNMRRPQR